MQGFVLIASQRGMWDNVHAELGASWPGSQPVTSGSVSSDLGGKDGAVCANSTSDKSLHFPGHYTTQNNR